MQLDYQTPSPENAPRSSLRRIPTTVALTGCGVALGLIVAMWIVALARGWAHAAFEENLGNHGPWRGLNPLGTMYEWSLLAGAGSLPVAGLGGVCEKSWRSVVAMGLSLLVTFVGCAHLPLFD